MFGYTHMGTAGAAGAGGVSGAATAIGATTTVAATNSTGFFPKYSIADIPDGTSCTVGMVERFSSFSGTSYNNTPWYPATEFLTSTSAYPLPATVSTSPSITYDNDAAIAALPPQIDCVPVTNASYKQPNSGHVGVLLVLMMDGSVRGVTNGTSATTWGYVMMPDDGSPIPSDW
jgi:hypothetical protein